MCGIVFASIALFPNMDIIVFGLSMPGWLYGIIYVTASIYGIKSQKDNIGHDAHLGGALIGMLAALALAPEAFLYNYPTIIIIIIPTLIFIYLIITKPSILLVDNFFVKTHTQYYSIDHKYNVEKQNRQQEIDFILDKINRRGLDSLSKKEKEALNKYANNT